MQMLNMCNVDIQVEALKMLYDKMVDLRREFYGTDRRDQFP